MKFVLGDVECYFDEECGVKSSDIFCNGNFLIERITSPNCISGICVEDVEEYNSFCDLGCVDEKCVEFEIV